MQGTQKSDKLDSLMNIVKNINTTIDLDETLSIIMDETQKITNSEASSLMLLDQRTKELYFNVATGSKGEVVKEMRVPYGKGVAGAVAKSGKGVIVKDAQNDPRIYKPVDEKTRMTTRNIICVPLVTKGQIIGVIEVLNKRGGKDYSKEDFSLLNAFSDFAAIAINNRSLYKQLERKAYEASALYQLSQSLNLSDDIDSMFQENIAVVCEAFEARRVSIIIKEDGHFVFKCGIGISDEVLKNGKITVEDNVLELMLQSGSGIVCDDVNKDKRFYKNKNLRYKSASFVAAPLKIRDEVIGFLCVTERTNMIAYKNSDLELLEMLAHQIADNYDHMSLAIENKRKEKLEAELSITARMQQNILPTEFESEGMIDASAYSRPAYEVGGDFYDYFKLGENKYCVIIADVSGKGMPAGLFMAIARSVMRVRFNDTTSPAEVFSVANKHIFKDSKTGMFVTSFCCVIDTKERKITYSNAGHFEQYLLRNKSKKIEHLHTSSKPLGVIEDETFEDKSINYSKGDVLALYTDGVTEAMNSEYEQYGDERLKSLLENIDDESSRNIIDSISESVDIFTGEAEQFDDMTMMMLRFK